MWGRSRKRLGSLFACAPGIALADADTQVVDCPGGDSIQRALEKKKTDRPLTVVIRGVCTEAVTVKQDDVTLEGDGGGIDGSVTIDGGRRAVVAQLTIRNPAGDGVTVANGGSATIRNNGIVNPTTIDASGIGVALGSMVRAARNEIRENANTGIEVFDNSTYRSEGDTIAMRTSGPGLSAVDTFRAGYVDLRGVTVNGQVIVGQQSQLQVRNLEGLTSIITGNIGVSGLSFLRLRAGVVRVGALSCVAASFSICQCDGFPSCP